MVSPITGPHVRSLSIPASSGRDYFYEQSRYRQRRPYNLALRYSVMQRSNQIRDIVSGNTVLTARENFNSFHGACTVEDLTYSGDQNIASFRAVRDRATNSAMTKFNSRRGEMAAIGVALAEARQSVSMITSRALQLSRFGIALAQFRFDKAAVALGIERGSRYQRLRKSGRLRADSHSLANNWLEFSFGWKPMIGDMYTAMESLSAPLSYETKVKAFGSHTENFSFGSYTPYSWHCSHSVTARVGVQAVLTVSNPNLDLAHRLGLTNPAMIAYELIKFSFVLNWFVNVEEYLSQWDSFYGVDVSSAQWNILLSDSAYANYSVPTGLYGQLAGPIVAKSFSRYPGSLPGVTLGVRPAFRLPLTRALNAISLLIQQGIVRR